MFKLPNSPAPAANTHELADFVEWLAWLEDSTSEREVLSALGRLDDNEDAGGCNDSMDETANILDEVFNEIQRRCDACAGGYPFQLDNTGTILRHASTAENYRHEIYLYLLLSTRLNMNEGRVHNNIDGTHLFEFLSAEVLRNYLGRERGRSQVFGTSSEGRFPQKVEDLCTWIGEGGGYRNRDEGLTHAKDDKLDVVAWIPFSDNKPGKLVLFAQCKTGTSWLDKTTQLQPRAFLDQWTDQGFVIDPVRVFCISEAHDRSRWQQTCGYAGLLFDRCRIIDYCTDVSDELLQSIRTWSDTAFEVISQEVRT